MYADCFEKIQQLPNHSLGYLLLSLIFSVTSSAHNFFYKTIYNRPFFFLLMQQFLKCVYQGCHITVFVRTQIFGISSRMLREFNSLVLVTSCKIKLNCLLFRLLNKIAETPAKFSISEIAPM